MSTTALAELQRAFVAALDIWDGVPPPGLVAHSGGLTIRMNTYRRNVFASLIGTLESRFPVVRRLTGVEFFRAMAHAFVEQNLPGSPVLLEYGQGFPPFIEGFPPAQAMTYLADVARLEWLQNEAYHAADAASLDATALSGIAADTLADTIFAFHPSLRLLRTPHPVLAIWRTNTHDATVRTVETVPGGEELLIVRPQLDVEIWRLLPGALHFIEALAKGRTLGAAAADAASRVDHFDLQRILAGLISGGCIVGYAH